MAGDDTDTPEVADPVGSPRLVPLSQETSVPVGYPVEGVEGGTSAKT